MMADAGAPVDRYHLLVVDDDVVDRKAVRRALDAAGLSTHIREAGDAASALERLAKAPVDCVLLDLHLPKVDGLALLRQLRNAGFDTPVIMLTGQGDEQTAVDIMKAGAADYIPKAALTPERLTRSIQHTVRVHRAEQAAATARRALEERERQYRFLAEWIPQMLWTADAEGLADYFNQRMYDYTGMTYEELRGTGWRVIVHPDDLPDVQARWQQAIRSGNSYEHEFRLRRHDGTYRWHLARAQALHGERGALAKWFGVCIDIDERRQVLQALERERARAEEANRAKDEFLATISHELRTPVNAILGWVMMLRSGALPEERRDRALETVERNARAQVQLIEDILDVSRIVTGKLRLQLGDVDLVRVIEAAADTVRPAAAAKGVELQFALDPDCGSLTGDAERLQQVCWNLLSNAVKFTKPGGRVEVTLQPAGSMMELTVHDTGQGIRPEFLPYVFERFHQADSGATRAQGGLGLGLAIVRHLVELHGGKVHAHSEGDGRGAIFTVRLPRPSAMITPGASGSSQSLPSSDATAGPRA